MENFKFNSSILKEEERTSYLTGDSKEILLDISKGVYPLLDVNILKEYNLKIIELIQKDYGYEYMDLSENGKYHEFKKTICNKFSEYGITPENIIFSNIDHYDSFEKKKILEVKDKVLNFILNNTNRGKINRNKYTDVTNYLKNNLI